MVKVGQTLLVPVFDEQRNPLLTTARVIAENGPCLTIDLPDPRRPIPGDRLEAYCHRADGVFHRLSVLVERVDAPGSQVRLRILTAGARVEHRRAVRVDVTDRHVTLTVARQARCRVYDISAAGLAFDAPGTYEPDERLPVQLECGNLRAAGTVVVRSVRVIGPRFRCGVFVEEDQLALRGLLDALMWRVLAPAGG